MAKKNNAKLAQKISNKLTKDFTKIVKNFVKTTTRGGSGNIAFVIGYLDAVTGRASDWKVVPKVNILDYSSGWKSGVGEKTDIKRKSHAT